jgi:hypothetical protein
MLRRIDNAIFDWIDGQVYARMSGRVRDTWIRLWFWYARGFERRWGEPPSVTNG